MIQTRSRLHGLVALALTLGLVMAAGIPAATFGQDKAKNDEKDKVAQVTPEPSPTPTPAPTPEPTPYPEFDPSAVDSAARPLRRRLRRARLHRRRWDRAPALPVRGRARRDRAHHRGR